MSWKYKVISVAEGYETDEVALNNKIGEHYKYISEVHTYT